MNVKLKITLIIIITLIIGIIIGAMANRAISHNRIKNILSQRRPDIFVNVYERMLQPDDEKSKQIREILNRHAKLMSEIRTNFMNELQSSMESLKAELEPLLTPEQKQRLERGLPGPPPFPQGPPWGRFFHEEISALKDELELTEEQVSQVEEILEKTREERFKFFRKEMLNLREKWQVMQEMEENKEKEIEKILTEEQKKRFKKLLNERREEGEKHFRRGQGPLKDFDFYVPGY